MSEYLACQCCESPEDTLRRRHSRPFAPYILVQQNSSSTEDQRCLRVDGGTVMNLLAGKRVDQAACDRQVKFGVCPRGLTKDIRLSLTPPKPSNASS